MATIKDLPDVSNRHTNTSENVDHGGRQNYGANYELHRAAFHGDLARVEELLAAKLDPSTQDRHGGWLKCYRGEEGVCVWPYCLYCTADLCLYPNHVLSS